MNYTAVRTRDITETAYLDAAMLMAAMAAAFAFVLNIF